MGSWISAVMLDWIGGEDAETAADLLLGSLRAEHKRLECLHVTLSAKSKTYPLFQHPGTEFIFMLEDVMDYSHSRSVYRLEAGDSLQMDGEGAHGPVDLIELPIRFLSVIAFPDSQV